ncbi:hypothetical protein SBC1_66370 (plasmid) [Caballeronia sp. SBC1]|nr:hypothetical protein SBC2_66100 [Caballeronia sp. SBC2]QIN66590.1 hypothetical protein SBC1_66370 [Caballeronia sp. SBC1]
MGYRLSTVGPRGHLLRPYVCQRETENLMEFISPGALQAMAGAWNMTAVYSEVDILIIHNRMVSQSIIKVTNQFQRRVLSTLCDEDQDQYAIGTGLIQDEVNLNNPITVVRNPDGTSVYVNTRMRTWAR